MIFIDHTEVLEGQVAVIDLTGPLDSDSSSDFEQYANRILDGETRYIILNMEKVDYISSAGIGLVLYLQKTIIRRGGYFVLFNLNGEISRLFSLLGFDRVLAMAKTRIEAMEIVDRQMELRDYGEEDYKEAPSEETADSFREKVETETTEKNIMQEVHATEDEPAPFPAMEQKESPAPIPAQRDETGTGGEEHLFEPFIVECTRCGALIRIKSPGTWLCPDCHASFSVSDEMTVSYE